MLRFRPPEHLLPDGDIFQCKPKIGGDYDVGSLLTSGQACRYDLAQVKRIGWKATEIAGLLVIAKLLDIVRREQICRLEPAGSACSVPVRNAAPSAKWWCGPQADPVR